MKPSPKLAILAAVLLAAPSPAQEPATRPSTTPATTTQPAATRPADATPIVSLFYDAADAFEALTDEQKQAMAAGPRAAEADLDAAQAIVDAFGPLLDRAGELDLDAAELSGLDAGAVDMPEYFGGINPLVSAAMVGLAPQLAEDGETLQTAAERAVNAAAMLRPLTRTSSTTLWFLAANADGVLRQTMGGRSLSIPAETMNRMATLPPLRDFHLITGEEGRELAELLRDSDELPPFLVQLAEAKEIAADDVATWRADWADPDRKAALIEEYELYFDVEVELAKLTDDTEAMERFLKEWEAGHENESLWLSRQSLMSPREAYALQFRQRAIADLFTVVAAGAAEEDLSAAVEAAKTVTGGGVIQARGGGDGRLLLVADVPLGEVPAILPVGP